MAMGRANDSECFALETGAVDLSSNDSVGTGVWKLLRVADGGRNLVVGGQVQVVQPAVRETDVVHPAVRETEKQRDVRGDEWAGGEVGGGVNATTAQNSGSRAVEVGGLIAGGKFPENGESAEDEHVDSKLPGALGSEECNGGVVATLADDALAVVVVDCNGQREQRRGTWGDRWGDGNRLGGTSGDRGGRALGDGRGRALGDGGSRALGDRRSWALGDGGGRALGDGGGRALGDRRSWTLRDGGGRALGDRRSRALRDGGSRAFGDGGGRALGDGGGRALG
eukprot:CAMPEP_0171478634 /NCGR_PEP_ID=MMETSP0946-20130122/4898_1 /TAXON_ID=109269 /ORGANISM="Vaucheria litorea, Strain CCMP2940" /LENGTH=281 /DNA_ID=CAMNT_0012009315 /DNA_START=307 /DNA_END=1151 /DNA_ORIENTATION=-